MLTPEYEQVENTKEVVTIDKGELKGLIFDIQGHSVHDGPGTRTTVFMNGCPLNCIWCCNPEGLFHNPVMLYMESRCVSCYACIKACPSDAITIREDKKLIHDRSKCDVCKTHECVDVCLHEASLLSGKYYTINELMDLFQRDRQFWGGTGGVSFSGGEPLLQRDFMLELLKRCKKSYIHVAVETTSCFDTDYYMETMNYINWVFTDIKHMDPVKHKELTGVDNKLILINIETLAAKEDWNGFIVPRIPIIPGLNDSDENIRETAKFVKRIGLEVINILPFHRLGGSKYTELGRTYQFMDQKPPSDEHMLSLKKLIEEEGLVCYVGYETPF
ncbi:MAG: glycyl-radical enzyme activating protein [Melioribacteraceae bacterium]|nr:glycyl-radical enzyme activating protein [Melioribacteraceae bacterium]